MFMQAGSAGELGRQRGLEQVGFWRKLLEHPAYDAFWRDQAMDKLLAAQPLKVPVMLVHSLWDQEDIYGAIAVYKAIEAEGHGQRQGVPRDGPVASRPGDRGRQHARRAEVQQRHRALLPAARSCGRSSISYLKDGAPKADVAPVTAFETGTNTWRRLPAWPAGCASGCTSQPTPLYLGAGSTAGFTAPKPATRRSTNTSPIPAKPVPFRARPIQPVGYDDG